MARVALQAGLLMLLARTAAGVVLLQERSRRATTVVADGEEDSSFTQVRQTCAALANNGSYFTVDVEVGTPGQRFSVVADTGSNALIVPSCICQQAGSCSSRDRCFTGTNRSASFKLIEDAGQPRGILLSFGSGTIQGVVAQEIVRVGGLEVSMTDGIMLMTGKALNFDGPFEGILGLGIPQIEQPGNQEGPQRGVIEGIPGNGDVEDIMKWLRRIFGDAQIPNAAHTGRAAPVAVVGRQQALSPPGFLEQTDVGRFAICFNEGRSGVLRLGPREIPSMTWHASIGVAHWGLDFRGISIAGDKMVHLDFCRPEDMREDQQTPCGAIPDSGTTMITGPQEQLSVLLGSVCDNWPRCSQNHSAMVKAAEAARAAAAEQFGFNPFDVEPWTKVKVLEALLENCEDWLDEAGGLDELPALHFHVAGGSGTEETLAMPGRAYVLETAYERKDDIAKRIKAPDNISSVVENITAAWLNYTGGRHKVCMPAFSIMEYNTMRNGPVWILGTPFFYEFNVGYDLLSKPPAIALQSVRQAPCGSCDAALGLVSSDADLSARDAAADAARLRRPRQLSGPVRRPSFELGRPL